MFLPTTSTITPGYTGPNINGRELVLIGKLAAQYNMPVQDTPDRVRYGFIGVIPFHQYGVHTGYGALLKLPLRSKSRGNSAYMEGV